jgi:hypothetical protein
LALRLRTAWCWCDADQDSEWKSRLAPPGRIGASF